MRDFTKLPTWLHTNKFFKKDLVKGGPMEQTHPEDANLVSSIAYEMVSGSYHYPVLDIDMPCELLPSTTPGHHHLVIQKLMSAEKYEALLNALRDAGILQQGVIDHQWKVDGMTAIRVPGEQKPKNSLSSGTKTKNSVEAVTNYGGQGIASVLPSNVNIADIAVGTVNSTSVNASPWISSDIKATEVKFYTESDGLTKEFVELAEMSAKTGIALTVLVSAWNSYQSAQKPDVVNNIHKAATKLEEW